MSGSWETHHYVAIVFTGVYVYAAAFNKHQQHINIEDYAINKLSNSDVWKQKTQYITKDFTEIYVMQQSYQQHINIEEVAINKHSYSNVWKQKQSTSLNCCRCHCDLWMLLTTHKHWIWCHPCTFQFRNSETQCITKLL